MSELSAASAARRDGYHHGRLREAMVEATVALIEELGPERVTVREAARRAGVSSGAPFRHFPNKTALMTAVAEEAMRRFQAEVARALAGARSETPFGRLRALGLAFLHWAIRNPTHFKVISDRSLIEFEGSA
jgi:AcrR family transcriptional regulator